VSGVSLGTAASKPLVLSARLDQGSLEYVRVIWQLCFLGFKNHPKHSKPETRHRNVQL
jgi:hypothetical protein